MISLWICEKIPQALQANYLGLDSWKPLAAAAGIRISYIRIPAYCFHKGSFSQPCGNPMAFVSTSGYSDSKSLKLAHNSFCESMAFSQYSKQQRTEYSRLATSGLFVIYACFNVIGSWGIIGITRFHTRPWWAQQLRSALMDFIQLSRISCWGTP